jgi:CheY-like chemotaxis protein
MRMANNLLSGRRVLIVEDEMLVLMMMEDMLADLGCETVSGAATIDQALALIDAQVFDVATLDLNLNGVKSFPVAAALASRGVPFVFVTGYGAQGLSDGYRDRPVLNKPYELKELSETLTRILHP